LWKVLEDLIKSQKRTATALSGYLLAVHAREWSDLPAICVATANINDQVVGEGPHACPKGLRHGFGVTAVSNGIALNMVQKWLGHAQLSTTAIYANAMGEEEQSIAARMW
jgi:site-specific recombinase XerD